MRLLVPLAVAALATAVPAAAHEPGFEGRYSPAYQACSNEAGSTHAMLDCSRAEYAVQDRAMNAAYQRVMATLNARQQAKLRKAQRAWIAWRDAKCESFQDEDWGTLSLVIASACLVDETLRRLIELEEYPPV